MKLTRRSLMAAGAAAVVGFAFGSADARWQEDHPTLTLGVITSENEADRQTRYRPVRDYLERVLGVEIQWRAATDYAGVIEGIKAGMIDIARFGPAAYAQAHMVTNGNVEPLVGELDPAGDFGYHAVVVVRGDSSYQSLEDLEGARLAFADPNSTSGHQAPRYFLSEAGVDVDAFFGETGFSGSHENSIMALLNGTYDAAATWWRSEERSNPRRMEEKGMIEPGQWRVVWSSPKLPSSPWGMSLDKPEQMRADVKAALMNMKDDDPEAWEALTDGQASGYRAVTHEDYEPIVRMIRENQRQRRSG